MKMKLNFNQKQPTGDLRLLPIVVFIVSFFHCFILTTSCTSIDCPLNNIVQTAYKLQGDVETLPYVLTVSTARNDGNDTVLLNQATAVDSFCLPISYRHPADTLYFEVTTTDEAEYLDTVVITKEDHQHFHSVDCAASYFHTITKVEATQHALDSIAIHRRNVTNEINEAHLYIYFKNDL